MHIGRCTGGPEDPVVTQMRDQPGEKVDLDTLLGLAPRSPRSLVENLPPLPNSPSFELIDSPSALADLLVDPASTALHPVPNIIPPSTPIASTALHPVPNIMPPSTPIASTTLYPVPNIMPPSTPITGTAQRPVLNTGSPSIPIVQVFPYSVPNSCLPWAPMVGTALSLAPYTRPLPGPIGGTALDSAPDPIPYLILNNYLLHTPRITACT